MDDGEYEAVVTATDDSGNFQSSMLRHFRVDNRAPVLKLTAPAGDLTRLSGDITFSFQADDMFAVTKLELVKDGGAPTDHSAAAAGNAASFDHTEMTRPEDNGFHTLLVKAWDANGNEATLLVEYSVDNYGYQGAAWGVILALAMLLIILAAFLTKPKRQRVQGGG
jgi:hypothetical protein